MTLAHANQLLALFRRRSGYLTTAEVDAAGLPRIELNRLVRRGDIERMAYSVYRLIGPGDGTPVPADLLEVQLRYPHARPCLISALHLHGLTTTRPARLQFAVPAHRRALHMPDLPTETFYFQPRAYELGLVELAVGGRRLTTYTSEKTLVERRVEPVRPVP